MSRVSATGQTDHYGKTAAELHAALKAMTRHITFSVCDESGTLAAVRGFGSKLAEHALRLAGILTLVHDIKASEIGGEQMEAGIELAEFYAGEALRIFGQAHEHPDLELARRVLAWAQSFQHVYLSQVYQHGPRPIRDKATALHILSTLEHHAVATTR